MADLFFMAVMIISGIAGLISLFVGAIGPGLALLVIAVVSFYLSGLDQPLR